MLTGYISCTAWNQGQYDTSTGEYSGSLIAVASDKLPITNALQALTYSGMIHAKQYVPPTEEGQTGSFVDVDFSKQITIYLFDAQDNYLVSSNLSAGGQTIDRTNYPNATQCIIQIVGGGGYRYLANPEDCSTSRDYTDCSINMSYTYTDWVMTGDGARARDAADIDIPEYQVPIPLAAWRIEQGVNDGFPLNKLMGEHVDFGAFANAHNLRQVSIPKSCKKIGRYAFRNTQLSSVTIARDCVYYSTSFPDGCVVNFYPD